MAESGTGLDAGLRVVHSRPLFCRVAEIEDPTAEIRIVRLAPAGGSRFCFRAGQYAVLAFGEHRPRPFSMASRPDDGLLEFHVRHGKAVGQGASAHAAALLRRGDGVWVEGPFGEAFLREQHAGPIIGIAGGTGVAPLLSIAATALTRQRDRPIHLYVGARDEAELYVATGLDRLAKRHRAFRWTPVLSQPGLPSARRLGMVTDALAADIASLQSGEFRATGGMLSVEGSKAYIAGPQAMVLTAVQILRAVGVDDSDLHADTFHRTA